MSKCDAVLIVGGGLLQAPLVQEAQALGLLPLVTDRNPHAPAFKLPGAQPFVLDTYDVAGHEELMRDLMRMYTVRGVCTAGADVAATVAAAAAVAGTPGIPLEVALQTQSKLHVRSLLTQASLHCYQPAYCWRSLAECEWPSISVTSVLDWPFVVKPLAQRASRGITIIQDQAMLETAIRHAASFGGATLLFEEYLTGTEHSVEGIFDAEGGLLWLNIVDRFFDYSSGVPIETGHVNPSALVPRIGTAVARMFGTVAHVLGVDWGPFKIDVLVTPEGHPKVLECAARLSGGWDCQGTSPLTGRHPMRALLQLACSLPVEAPLTWAPAQGYAACAAILVQGIGCITRMPNTYELMLWLENERMKPGSHIEQILWVAKLGDSIAPAAHNGERAGFVLAHASTDQEAWHQAKTAADALAAAVEVIA